MTNYVKIISNSITNYAYLIPKNLDIINAIIIPILPGAITGAVIGILVFYFTSWKTEKKLRITKSIVGDALLASFAEEVQNGINLIETLVDLINIYLDNRQKEPNNKFIMPKKFYMMPNKSWDGMKSVSDEILERIIKVSKNIENDIFPPKEIKTHLKNYFEFICSNVNDINKELLSLSGNHVESNYLTDCKTSLSNNLDASRKVLKTLKVLQNKLVKNGNEIFPK